MEKNYFDLDSPVEVITKHVYNKFAILSIDVVVNQLARIIVELQSDDNIMRRIFVMDNIEYKQWSNDDNYIIEWIKNKLSSIN